MRIFTFLLKRVICIMAFSCLSLNLFAQVSVTATAGTATGSYTTVNAAFTAINAGSHQGNVVITVTASTTEPATPVPLLKSASPSSYSSIKLVPSGNVTINSNAAAATNRGIIELAGADNVTIDGDDPLTAGTSNLTILAATSTTAGIACIRLSSNSTTGTDGADNNIIKNCTIIGSRSAASSTVVNYGIQFSNGITASVSTTGAYSSLNTLIEGNIITKCLYGIWANGTSATYLNTGTIIRKNVLGSATAADNIGSRGIYIQYSATTAGSGSAALIEENDIRVGEVSASATGYALNLYGIMLEIANAGCVVRKNNIHDVMQPATGGYLSSGVAIVSGTSNAAIEIYNNFIRDIVGSRYSSSLPSSFMNYGIYINAGATDVKINHNTIAFFVPNVTGTTVNNTSSCILITSTATAAEIKNNILINNNVSTQAFGIFTAATTNISTGAIDNNSYNTGSIGYYNAANVSTLSAWQTATGKDAASFVYSPTFISATNLHIATGTVSRLESGGQSTYIATDIDGDARPGPAGSVNGGGTSPDVGADEFDGTLLPPNNFAATALINPVNGGVVPTGISFTPQASFSNNGLSPQTGVSVRYKILNASSTVVYNQTATTGSLNSGASETVSFPPTTITTAGTYTLQAIAELAGDAVASDNQVNGTITTVAPLCGTYHIGSAQASPFNTLTSAINTAKTVGISCAVTFLLDDATYSTAETFPITITEILGASATSTLTIKPNAGVTSTITGSSAVSIFKLNGADYVIFDGSNNGTSSRNLTIQNTNTGTSSVVVWLGSASATNGANNNTIKNCIVTGNTPATTFAGIVSSSGTSIGGVAEAENSFNTYTNNTISSSYYGLAIVGVTAGDQSLIVDGNVIGSTTTANKLGFTAMFISNQTGFAVRNNTVSGIASAATGTNTNAVVCGINILGASQNGEVRNNKITDIKNSGAYSAYGIQLASSVAASNNFIYNNFIGDLAGTGSATVANNGHGIYISTGGGYNIYFNTISLTSSPTLATAISAPITISSGVSTTAGLNIQNNILSNTQTTGVRYAIYSGVTAANNAGVYATLDNNNYWSTGTNLAYFSAANQANLSTLQGAFGNSSSHQILPVFVSASDLHISNDASNQTLDNLGLSIPTITTDIDAQTRSTSTPDIGADEFSITTCTGANGGTAAISQSTLCVSGSSTLTASGYSSGLTSTYQWQYSNDNFVADVHDLAGETNPLTAATGTIGSTTYYRLKAVCPAASLTGYSNIVTLTVNNPQVLTAVSGTRCGTGTVSLTGTASASNTLNWYANATGGSALGTGNTFVTPTVSATTTFYVSARSAGGTTQTSSNGVPTVTTSTQNGGLQFTLFQDVLLNSIQVFSTAAGTATVTLQDNTGAVLFTSSAMPIVASTLSVPQTLPLNWNVAAGTGYRILVSNTGNALGYASGAFPAPMGNGVGTITSGWQGTTTNTLNYFVYNISTTTGCESGRTPVDAIVNTAPALSVSPDKTICNNAIDSLTVTSNLANFNTYTWSPTTNLFTDAAGTIAYTGTSTSKVFVKGSTAAKIPYKVTANNTTTLCANEMVDTIYIMPVPTATTTPAALCMSGSATLSLTPATGFGNGFFQWQESTNGTTYADISGANSTTYTTSTITSTMYYKMLLKNSFNETCSSAATGMVTVNNPQVTGTTPNYTCGPGAVTLKATGSAGSTLNWFANPTGGTTLGTGTSFTTPSIPATTTYYVAASTGGGTSHAGLLNNVAALSYFITTNWGITFDCTAPTTIQSVAIYPQSAGSMVIAVQSSMSSPIIFGTYTATFTTADIGTKVIVPINIAIPTAGTGYKMIIQSYTGLTGVQRETIGAQTFPFTTPGSPVSVTSSEWGGTTTGTYYFFYDLTVSTSCESPRVSVEATVNNSPGCVVTPISLLSFTGERKNSINTLNWVTANELNNAGFELQRSVDGINFSKLATVSSKAVNGNSIASLQYSFVDIKSLTTTSYYRLKQIDKDGKASFSNIVMLKGDKATQLVLANVYPNPAKEKLNVVLASPKADRITLVVMDVTGKQVMSKNLNIASGDNNLQLNVQHLTQGSYLIKAICADGCQTAIKMFVKD